MVENPKRWKTESSLLVVLVAVPMFFLTSTMDVFNTPKEWLLLGLSSSCFTHWALGDRLRLTRLPRITKIYVFLNVALAIFMTLSTAFTSTSLAKNLWGSDGRANGLIFYWGVMVCGIVASSLRLSENFESHFHRAIEFLLVVNMLYALLQHLGLDPINWNNPYNPIIGTLGNPNFISAFMGIGSIYFFLRARAKSGIGIKFRFLLMVLCGYLAFATESIQGPMLVVIGFSIMVLAKLKSKLRTIYFGAITSLSIAASFFLFISFLGYGPVGNLLYQYTLKLRLEYWYFGVRSGLEKPLTGLGVDSYVEGFRKFRSSEFVGNYGINLTSDSAHNVPINIFANFGIINFMIFTSISIILIWKSISNINQDLGFKNLGSITSLFWILLFIQSLFSIEQIGLGTLQWIFGGIVLNGSLNEVTTSRPSRIMGKQQTQQPVISKSRISDFRGELAFGVLFSVLVLTHSVIKEEIQIKSLAQTSVNSTTPNEVFLEKEKIFTDFTEKEVKRLMWYVDFLLRGERIAEAKKLLIELLEIDPEATEAREQLARINRYNGEVNKEIENRLLIKSFDPTNYNNLLLLADAYLISNMKVQASEVSNLILSMSPDTTVKESATLIIERSKG